MYSKNVCIEKELLQYRFDIALIDKNRAVCIKLFFFIRKFYVHSCLALFLSKSIKLQTSKKKDNIYKTIKYYNFFIAAHIINLNETAKANLKRARVGRRVHQSSKLRHAVRDGAVRAAMNAMKSNNPWSVQRFLTDLSEPEYNAALFEMLDLGNFSRQTEMKAFNGYFIYDF